MAVTLAVDNIRTTVISPGAVATELPNSVTDPRSRSGRTPSRAVAFAISQPEEVDVNEILFRRTRQEL
jgi:NADP-dependent 3-hydroxy acid dehydrogenase YdfG